MTCRRVANCQQIVPHTDRRTDRRTDLLQHLVWELWLKLSVGWQGKKLEQAQLPPPMHDLCEAPLSLSLSLSLSYYLSPAVIPYASCVRGMWIWIAENSCRSLFAEVSPLFCSLSLSLLNYYWLITGTSSITLLLLSLAVSIYLPLYLTLSFSLIISYYTCIFTFCPFSWFLTILSPNNPFPLL